MVKLNFVTKNVGMVFVMLHVFSLRSAGVNTLTVSSNSFASGASIPSKHGYTGENISPHLSWTKGLEDTKSYVVVCEDPDAPRKDPWVHWIVFNIPASTTVLPEGFSTKPTHGIEQGTTDYQTNVYGGPNPPSGTHSYYFYVYGLDSELPELKGKKPSKAQLMKAIDNHVLAKGTLMGTYSASK
jgi:Raf kinase inhibitor-like YbhB/YbcL family protein